MGLRKDKDVSRESYNEYQRVYQLERYHRRRAQAIEKLGGECVVCGFQEDLEFDHIDPQLKSFSVSSLWSSSESKFWPEIEKCQLLCKEHHQEKTSAEQSVEHGKGLTGKKSCRCELCGPLKNEHSRNWKANKRKASR